MIHRLWFLLFITLLTSVTNACAQVSDPYFYQIGSPSLREIYVDPANGNDGNNGLSIANAFRTVQAAYRVVPKNSPLTIGYRINLLPGTYSIQNLPNFWENVLGTFEHPFILRALQGRSTVLLTFGINSKNMRYFYLIDLRIIPVPHADPLHFELGNHILVRGVIADGGREELGDDGSNQTGRDTAREVLKANQTQFLYVEDSDFSGADDNALDAVAVQYGHIVNSSFHHAGDWCVYNKGGSAYLRVEGNEFHHCGTGGYTAGQGTGYEFMESPWVHYEAYDIKVINNIAHHLAGAAFGVNGGYNILIAFNTAYSVGTRSHMIEFVPGLRSCDGDDVRQGQDQRCSTYRAVGGWGPSVVTTGGNDVTPGASDPQPIPNKNVFVFNNIFYNPPGVVSPMHIAVHQPRNAASGTNIHRPSRFDDNLVIKGNIFWNGTVATPSGIGGDTGCQDNNPTCNEAQLRAENAMNVIQPQLLNPAVLDFRPIESSNIFGAPTVALSPFAGGDRIAAPLAPEGNLANQVGRDRGDANRPSHMPPGAYVQSTSPLRHDPVGDSVGDGGPGGGTPRVNTPPTVSRVSASCRPRNGNVVCTLAVFAVDTETAVLRVGVTAAAGRARAQTSLRGRAGRYSGSLTLRGRPRAVRLVVTAADSESLRGQRRADVRVR